MPDGAQSWKMIKPPGAMTERMAQACDRCRSKKVKCDGKRPACGQCAAVGFDCKATDKLSRRAYPRGYTESLEKLIKELEDKNRELKKLLDEKEDRLDRASMLDSAATMKYTAGKNRKTTLDSVGPDAAQPAVSLIMRETSSLASDGTFEGASSGRTFGELFTKKIGEKYSRLYVLAGRLFEQPQSVRHSNNFKVSDHKGGLTPLPSRAVVDPLVHSYFQSWELFPALHEPSFYTALNYAYSDPKFVDPAFNVLLNLVLSISSRSCRTSNPFEQVWQQDIDQVLKTPTLLSLQIAILAQIDLALVGATSEMHHYKMIAVGLVSRLGLNQCQKAFEFPIVEKELRRRVFWCTYILDCVSSAALGTPRSLHDGSLECAIPSDVDDLFIADDLTRSSENPSDGTHTRIFSFLKLIELAKIQARILDDFYLPVNRTQYIQNIHTLEDDLHAWRASLPSDMKLEFLDDNVKADPNIRNSAVMLCMSYQYTKMLLHRPLLCTELPDIKSSSLTMLLKSAKSIAQLLAFIRDLEKSGSSFRWAFPMSLARVAGTCCLTILYGAIDYPKDGTLIKDARKQVYTCLSCILDNPGLTANEYQHLEKLCDSVLGMEDSSHDDLPLPLNQMLPCGDLSRQNTSSLASYHQLNMFPTPPSSSAGEIPAARLDMGPENMTSQEKSLELAGHKFDDFNLQSSMGIGEPKGNRNLLDTIDMSGQSASGSSAAVESKRSIMSWANRVPPPKLNESAAVHDDSAQHDCLPAERYLESLMSLMDDHRSAFKFASDIKPSGGVRLADLEGGGASAMTRRVLSEELHENIERPASNGRFCSISEGNWIV
ncbi:hypothetical protein CANCADRAFT_56320 [Tortispora caseinolytica NRRL Y-17796]|uniref:Zn(2)-C6 fungal-type domain-containing protein n=1 Tax=Tortispora caseinolytica NRRL Y-17796 TaxID=767744 RepID=A0A1E4TLX4_9ASCO|nr:hypothetical protein CANCADRAFT_56320 [Tortispora caseinolytica NRRL Y-17796]